MQGIVSATPADLQTLLKLRKVLDLVQNELDPEMPIGYLRAMVELMIAHIDTGPNRIDLTQKDIIERTGMAQSTVSRAVNALADSRTHGNPYHIADNMPHPMDRRYRHVRLNPRGLAVMRRIVETLK